MQRVYPVLNFTAQAAQVAFDLTVITAKVAAVALHFFATRLYEAVKNYFSGVKITSTPLQASLAAPSSNKTQSPPVLPSTPLYSRNNPNASLNQPSVTLKKPSIELTAPRYFVKVAPPERKPSSLRQSYNLNELATLNEEELGTPARTPTRPASTLNNPQAHLTPSWASLSPLQIQYPSTPEPRIKPVRSDDSPTTIFGKLMALAKNPAKVSATPFVMIEGEEEFTLTEKRLAFLEGFFQNYDETAVWSDFNPYLFSHLLSIYEKRAKFNLIDPSDRARISKVILDSQACKNLKRSGNFYFHFPVTFDMLSQIESALNGFLSSTNKLFWINNHFSENGVDFLYWCYQLEKGNVEHPVLDQYRKARDHIFNNPNLSTYCYIDPFKLTIGEKEQIIDAKFLLDMNAFIESIQKKDVLENCLKSNAASSLKEKIEEYDVICKAFENDETAYNNRPETDRKLIKDIIFEFEGLKRRSSRAIERLKQAPLPTAQIPETPRKNKTASQERQFVPIRNNLIHILAPLLGELHMNQYYAYLESQWSQQIDGKGPKFISFQEINVNHQFDTEVSKEIRAIAAYFDELNNLEEGVDVAHWVYNQAVQENYCFPFYKTFLLLFPRQTYDVPYPEDVKELIPEIIENYFNNYSKLAALLENETEMNLNEFYLEGLKPFVK